MRLFDTLTKSKVELPEPPARIGMYTCGPTVYQRIHIGNARPYVLSLWLKRWLALQGEQGGRGHVVGFAVGTRPPRLAHRMLGDGGEVPRAGLRHPPRRSRPRVSAPRERARAVAGRRPGVRAHLAAQRAAAARQREDVEVRRQHRPAPRRRPALGARGGAALLPHGPLVEADRLLRRGDGGGAGARGRAPRDLPRR